MQLKFTSFKSLFCLFVFFIAARSYAQTSNQASLKAKIIANSAVTGLPASYINDATVSSSYKDAQTGIEYVYLQQSYKGIDVYNQVMTFAFKDDKLVSAAGTFISRIENKAGSSVPAISSQDALLKAAAHLKLAPVLKELQQKVNNPDAARKAIFSPAGIAKRDIEVKLYWTPDTVGKLHLTWNVNIDVLGSADWWNVRVDALTGNIIGKDNWTVHEQENYQPTGTDPANGKRSSAKFAPAAVAAGANFLAPPSAITSAAYYVIPYPAENNNAKPLTLDTNPWEKAGAGNNATTLGWQNDGSKDYTVTRGNNVYAYDDSANKNIPGRPAPSLTPAPDLLFKATPDFSKDASDSINRTAATINLFYWNNIMHDVMYQYGFDESSGNFQSDNMSRGGAGKDYVLAEAQDGSGTDNANFNTPPDGFNGRMQMYLWSAVPTLTVNTPDYLKGNYYTIESAFSNNNQLINVGPVSGNVVYYSLSDTLGCTALPAGNTSLQGKIALIYRGSCSFSVKVKNAQNAGATGAIVVNNAGAPIIMGGSDSTVIIPALMISTEDGARFTAAIRSGSTVSATMANNGIHLDGDLDAGIMTHEYGHGVSNRLTGGPANASCLSNAEEGGEGWSDYQALMITTDWSTAGLSDGPKPRAMGTYVTGEPATGIGIRRFPYSTDMSIDPLTYNDLAANTEVHAIGEIWCAALWDMTWNIIQQEGTIEKNLYNSSGNGGNAIALRLVLQGMKLQPCSPGFIDARNAILTADSLLYNYRHKCAIWNAFARRGMGVGADQGLSTRATDQVANFDVPGVTLTRATEPVVVQSGVTMQFTATCGCTLPGGSYTLRDTIPGGFSYAGSSGGTLKDSVVSFDVNFDNLLQQKTFSVTLNVAKQGCGIDTTVYDDRDAHKKGGFTNSVIKGKINWVTSASKFYSPSHSWFAADGDTISNLTLTSDAFTPAALSTLSFWHYFNTENSYDGGMVELSTNGGATWMDAKPYFTKNGYNGFIDSAGVDLPKAAAFTGNKFATFYQSLINLSSFSGKNIRLRFRMRSDQYVGLDGWYIDDITVANGCGGMQNIGLYSNTGAVVDGFSIPTYNTAAVLPVTLVNFNTALSGTSVLLTWKTAAEVNTKAFVIESSKDGIHYTAMETVNAKGQSTNDYTAYDLNPYNGLNYYRIKIIDRNGAFTYTPVRTVVFTGKDIIVIKPNPARNSTTVYFKADANASYITVTDMQGKLITQASIGAAVSSYTVNTANLAAGTYLLKVYLVTGGTTTVKLIVSH